MAKFNFTSSIKDVQNRMIASTIRDVSNLDLLRSEEAIKDVIKSYTDRFKVVEGMLTDVAKYVAKSKEIVKLDSINNLFESLYIDIAALYSDLEIIDNILTLNLARNKNYFLVIKKRVRDLWQRLELTRLQVYDLSPADELFYESFYSAINSTYTSNVEVDKKNGYLVLSTKRKRLLNDFPYIKTVTSTTYPVENEEGGVISTTSPLNDLNENYTSGTRDLLTDGLWKEELLCKDVPNMVVNIGSDANPIRRNYHGVVSIVDIEYAYPVEINRLDIDIFGEKILDIDAILYKLTIEDEWVALRFEPSEYLAAMESNSINYESVKGRAFDIISFLNIKKTKIKFLRLVFNQQNYSLLDSNKLPERTLEQQIDLDFQERRYELVKFGASLEESLAVPVNDNNTSLYYKVMESVESTRNIEEILEKINRILVPDIKTVTTSFSKTARFELGAWSIEPSIEEYTRLVGKYDSKLYTIKNKNLIAVQIKANQEIPNSTTCNWYVTVNGLDIPVLENNSVWRKEPINFINILDLNTDYSDWPGSFILLDFPIDPANVDSLGIYENGVFNYSFSTKIAFLNSRLLYLADITDPARADYVVQYAPARHNCVSLYCLNPKITSDQFSKISLGIVSARRDILEGFARRVKSKVDGTEVLSLNENYTISSALATYEEAQSWFGSSFSSCIFINDNIKAYLELDLGVFDTMVTYGPSKLDATINDMNTYYSGSGVGPSDLSLIALYPNLAPLTTRRIV